MLHLNIPLSPTKINVFLPTHTKRSTRFRKLDEGQKNKYKERRGKKNINIKVEINYKTGNKK